MKEKQRLLADSLTEARAFICQAAGALGLAYKVKSEGARNAEFAQFAAIRSRITDSVDLFRRKVWPFTNDYVRNLKDFLNEYYGPHVEFEDWKDDLGDCLDAAKAYECISISLAQMYRRLAREFAKEKERLTTLALALNVKVELLNRELEKLAASMEANTRKSAGRGHGLAKENQPLTTLAAALNVDVELLKRELENHHLSIGGNASQVPSQVPLLGPILEDVCRWEKQKEWEGQTGMEALRKQWTETQQKHGLLLGVESVRWHLVPALENFGESMEVLAGFFDVMRRDLIAISEASDTAKRRHFISYQETAVAVSVHVDAFNMVESAVSVMLSSLPESATQKVTKEAMDRKAEAWLQSIIDEQETEEEARQLIRAVKATFSRGMEVKMAVEKGWISQRSQR